LPKLSAQKFLKHLPVKRYNSLRVASGLALADSRRVARQVLGY
jgi:hypothetical protein